MLLVHDRGVAMAEGMESAALNVEFCEQRIKPALPYSVRVQWSAGACREQQAQAVRFPRIDVLTKMLHQERRNLTSTITLLRLQSLNLAVPHALHDPYGTLIQEEIRDRQTAYLTGTNPGFGQNPIVRFVRFSRCQNQSFHLLQRKAALGEWLPLRQN